MEKGCIRIASKGLFVAFAIACALAAAVACSMPRAAYADQWRDVDAKTSAFIAACVDVRGQSQPAIPAQFLRGVEGTIYDEGGVPVATKKSGADGLLIFPGLAWGKTYTFETTSVPTGMFPAGYRYKAGATKYEVSVTDQGWVLVDGRNGNGVAASAQFPGVNHLHGKTPFKLYFDAVPQVVKTVNGQDELDAAPGDELVFEISTTLSPAAAYSFSAQPVADLRIGYGTVSLTDELDAMLEVREASLLLDGAPLDDTLARVERNVGNSGTTLVAAFLTEAGMNSLDTAWPNDAANRKLTLRIVAALKDGARAEVANRAVLALGNTVVRSNEVVVIPPAPAPDPGPDPDAPGVDPDPDAPGADPDPDAPDVPNPDVPGVDPDAPGVGPDEPGVGPDAPADPKPGDPKPGEPADPKPGEPADPKPNPGVDPGPGAGHDPAPEPGENPNPAPDADGGHRPDPAPGQNHDPGPVPAPEPGQKPAPDSPRPDSLPNIAPSASQSAGQAEETPRESGRTTVQGNTPGKPAPRAMAATSDSSAGLIVLLLALAALSSVVVCVALVRLRMRRGRNRR